MMNDPWSWNTDQVVFYFCHSDETWTGRANSSKPDLVKLAKLIRDQRLDGATLLEEGDDNLLKDDLGLCLRSERAAIRWALDNLRKHSVRFRALATGPIKQEASPSALNKALPFAVNPPFAAYVKIQDDPFSTPSTPMRNLALSNPPSQPSSHTHDSDIEQNIHQINLQSRTPFQPVNQGLIAVSTRYHNLGSAQAHTIKDEDDGRLPGSSSNLATTEPLSPPRSSLKRTSMKIIEILSDDTPSDPTEVKDQTTRRGGEYFSFEKGSKRRRLKLSSLQSVPKQIDGPLHVDDSNSYLSREKVSIDSMFYGECQHGDIIESSESEEDTFLLRAADKQSRVPPGQTQFTHRRMRYHLLNPAVEITPYKFVSHPYPERLVLDKHKRSATTFTHLGNDIIIRKVDASLAGSGLEDMKQEQPNGEDNSWDYLLTRYPPGKDDKVLPFYEGSGSENDYEGSLLDEIEFEQRRVSASRKQSKVLSEDEISRIIDEKIEEFRESWRTKRASYCHSNAWHVWRNARGRYGPQTVSQHEQSLGRLDTRLAKLKKEISGNLWTNPKSLRGQCKSFEETVYSQQDLKWRLQLCHSNQEPPRILKTNAKKGKKVRPARSDEDDSESVGSEPDSLIDFIEIDESADEAQVPPAVISTKEPDQSFNPFSLRENSQECVLMQDQQSENPSDVFRANNATEAEDVSMQDHEHAVSIGEAEVNSESGNLGRRHFQDMDSADSLAQAELLPVPQQEAQISTPNSTSPESDAILATEEEIKSWDWGDLKKQKDCKKIVVKLLQSTPSSLRKQVEMQISAYRKHCSKLRGAVQRTLTAIHSQRKTISGLNDSQCDAFFKIARLWVCWSDVDHLHYPDITIPSSVMAVASRAKEFDPFFKFICSRVTVANESDAEDDDAAMSAKTPHKFRKKKIIKSQQGVALREIAQKRRVEGDERALKLEQELNSGALSMYKDKIVVNTTKEENEELVFLNPHIASRILAHQVDGLRFLWREIISVSRSTMQGCLLAHTMGLGKTMQTISLLVTIAESAADQRTVSQIPENLRRMQALILSPAALIENWLDEMRAWIPPGLKNLGPVLSISSADTIFARINIVTEWNKKGGILILGYDIFRTLASPETLGKKYTSLSEEQCSRISDFLLQRTTIVVADEAHKLKNRSSAVSRAATKFLTQSRVALTGSPLSNNVGNYYSMIDWVAPGYLGDPEEFQAFYQEPIENGMYADAPASWIRTSMKKSHALKRDIEPKVHRAGATILSRDLKPKTEFVMSVQLTDWQKRAYLAFLESTKTEASSNFQSKLFDLLQLLTLLCDHPCIFLDALKKRQVALPQDGTSLASAVEEESPGAKTQADHGATPSDDTNDSVFYDDMPEDIMEVSDVLLQRQIQIASANQPDSRDDAEEFSAKMLIIRNIIVQAKQIGDQILIFSQRLLALNYIEQMIKRLPDNITHFKFEGSTPPAKRIEMVKEFNAGKRDAFLMSTKAGGLGLNIASANRVILVDFSFNPMHEEQAVGRAYRIGQQKPVFVYHLVTAGTFEATLHNATIFKKQLASTMVDKKNLKRAASRENVYLAHPKDVPQADLEPFKDKDVIMDSILNGEAGKLIREIKTADTLQAESDERLEDHELQEVETLRAEYHGKAHASSAQGAC